MAWTREKWEVQKVWTEVTDLVLDLSDPKLILKYCDQKLDHFDEENTKTWCQRFLINATFQKPNGPAFICIDGEDYPWLSGRRPYTMACHNMAELAKDFGAIMLAVEHRYYGGADFDGVTSFDTENLKYLSSRQALADLAGFWTWISKELEPVSSVVVFGGSYPGSLSAWARKLYPETFQASVASSAPLLAQANFWGYNDVVASALTAPSVGGSPECLSTYSKGHAELGEMMATPEGRRAVEKKFNLCGYNPLDDNNNIAYWAGQDGIVATIPQYNSATCEYTSCNIKLFCGNLSIMSKSSVSALDALQLMAEYQIKENVARGREPSDCTDASYQKYVDGMKSTVKVPGTDPKAGDQYGRLWTYQTCAEFGWYQTCEIGTNCPYTQGYNTIGWALELCGLLFDMKPGEVLHNIDETNRHYGGARYPNATKTIFPNGEVDPWHWESTLIGEDPHVDAIFVKGASHCEWMHAVKPGMPGMLISAKEAIKNKIASWLPAPSELPKSEMKAKEMKEVKVKDAEEVNDVKDVDVKKVHKKVHKKPKPSKSFLATESEVISHMQLRTDL